MVAPWKIEELKELKELIKKHKTIGIIEVFGMPAAPLHEIRKRLRKKAIIRMSKKRIIEKALKETENEEMVKFLGKMPALIFTNEDPIKIFKEIMRYKIPAPAKPGAVAPKDIVIPAGPTPLPPMAIGQLKALGLKTKVEGGKVVILEDKVVVKKGEEIKKEIAELVNKLDLKPLEVCLNVLCLSDKKTIFSKEDLELCLKDFREDMKEHFLNALYLGIGIGWINKYTSIPIIRNAYLKALSLARGILLPVKESVEEFVKRAYRIANVLNERLGGV